MDAKTAKQLLIAMLTELETLSAQAAENRKPIALDQTSVGRLSRMDSLQIQAMDNAAETGPPQTSFTDRSGTDAHHQ